MIGNYRSGVLVVLLLLTLSLTSVSCAKKAPHHPKVTKCGPNKVWIAGHYNHRNVWIPGHCAPKY